MASACMSGVPQASRNVAFPLGDGVFLQVCLRNSVVQISLFKIGRGCRRRPVYHFSARVWEELQANRILIERLIADCK